MPIEKPRFMSDPYIGSFARDNAQDMSDLEMV